MFGLSFCTQVKTTPLKSAGPKDPVYIFFFLLAFITDVKGQGHITKEKRLIDLFGFCHLRDTESFFLM